LCWRLFAFLFFLEIDNNLFSYFFCYDDVDFEQKIVMKKPANFIEDLLNS